MVQYGALVPTFRTNFCFQVLSWTLRLYFPLKRWYLSTRLHGLTFEYVTMRVFTAICCSCRTLCVNALLYVMKVSTWLEHTSISGSSAFCSHSALMCFIRFSLLAVFFCNQQNLVYHCNGDCSEFSVRWELNCYILCLDVNLVINLIHYTSIWLVHFLRLHIRSNVDAECSVVDIGHASTNWAYGPSLRFVNNARFILCF
jgi:hypothetical protein